MEEVSEYEFTTDWFKWAVPVWEDLFSKIPKDRKVNFLEIGSFEGRSAVWLIENAIDRHGAIYCVDTWEGGEEHKAQGIDMVEVEKRFDANIATANFKNSTVSVIKKKATSYEAMASLVGSMAGKFDFIYIDGSHQATDVMTDACMALGLLKEGGVMVFDDYLWDFRIPQMQRPKIAIDLFATLFEPKINIVNIGYQYIIQRKV